MDELDRTKCPPEYIVADTKARIIAAATVMAKEWGTIPGADPSALWAFAKALGRGEVEL